MARILIIDDNETMREGLGATVRRMGHEAVLATPETLAIMRARMGEAGAGTVQQPIRRVRAAGRRYRIPIQASGSRTPAIKELLRAL